MECEAEVYPGDRKCRKCGSSKFIVTKNGETRTTLGRCYRKDCPGDAVNIYEGFPVCEAHYRYLNIVKEGDLISSIEARKWLIDRGIVNESMSKAEWQKATARYRQKVSKTFTAPVNKDWALMLKTRHLDGEPLLPVQKKMAQDALGEDWSVEI